MSAYVDKTFPGVEQVLDVDGMRTLVQQRFDDMGLELGVESGRIWDVQYAPHRMCVVLYRFKLRRRATRRSRSQLFTVRLLAAEEEWPRLSTEDGDLRQLGRLSWVPVPCFTIADPRIVVYVYPFDPVMPWMFDAIDPRTLRRRLNQLGSERGWKVRSVGVDLLGYTPRMRASFLYRVTCEDREFSLVAKTNAFKTPGKLFAGYWALWKAGGDRVALPAPVGYFSYPPLTLQETIEGDRLGSMVDATTFPEVIRKTARIIAAVHGLRIPLLANRKTKDELRSLDRWSDLLARIQREEKRRVEDLQDRIRREIEARTMVVGPVHGDFHHTNVLVDGTTVRLIDLDEMALGDPAVDVGRFLASLRVPSLRVFGTIEGLADARALFLEEYLRQSAVERERIRLFEAASLLTAAASAFRVQRPTWRQEVSLLLDESERILGEAVRTRTSRNGDPATDGLPYEEREAWARDMTYMGAAFDRPIRKGFGAYVGAVRLGQERRVHGARLLRYRVRGRLEGHKWSATLECVLFEKRGGKRIFERLTWLLDKADPGEETLRLPRPIDYLAPLSLLITEPVEGRPLTSVLPQKAESGRAARGLGRALAAFHRSDLGPARPRPLVREMELLAKRVQKLPPPEDDFRKRAAGIVAWLQERFPESAEEPGPVLTALHPRRILWDGNHAGVSDISRLGLAEPLLDVADLIAQLHLHGARENCTAESERFTGHFREAYLGASGRGADRLRVVEVEALLQLACLRREREPATDVPWRLLEGAEHRINEA